jgi:hypothetical protein
MTGEKNSFSGFKKQCDDIYIPGVIGFEKSDAEYGKLTHIYHIFTSFAYCN